MNCKLRKDLADDDLLVPIWLDTTWVYIGSIKETIYEYKWVGEKFFIKYMGEWRDAYSIDFDFID